MTNESVLRAVDDDARRQAGSLLRTGRSAALATLEPATGMPLASRIAIAPDFDGAPVFLISRLSPHFAALEASPGCSILVGEPGRGDPLAHPRMTVVGEAGILVDDAHRAIARHRFLGRHPKAALYVDFADFAFWKMNVQRASLNAGFGKAYALTADDVLMDLSEATSLIEISCDTVDHMNRDHADVVALFATKLLGQPSGAWRIASLDSAGMDLTDGDVVRRFWFERPVPSGEDLRELLVTLAGKARQIAG